MKDKPTDQELIDEYNEFYKDKPGRWGNPTRTRFMFDKLRDRIEPPKTVLDVGCGHGLTLQYLARRWPGAELHGMDLSGEALRLANQRVPGFTAHQGFLESQGLEQKFDLVVCMGVAEHFRDLATGFKKLRQVTGGVLYLEVPNALAYSPGDHGYRRTSVGSKQWEWHLPRYEWVKIYTAAGFKTLASLEGKRPPWEFVWILT